MTSGRHSKRWRGRRGNLLAAVTLILLAAAAAFMFVRSDDPRAQARRLVRSGAIRTMTRDQIVARFGEPAQTNKWQGYTSWVLGPSGYMPIDHTWLIVQFDEHGIAAEARVVED